MTGVNGANFATTESRAVLFQENIGTTGLPKKNCVYGIEVLGDSNMDWIVKDNCTVDNGNDNRVYMVDASQPTSIVHANNTKVYSSM